MGLSERQAASFSIGPLGSAIAAGALESWFSLAPVGDRIVYAQGLVLPRGTASVLLARELADCERLHLFQRRKAESREWEWIAEKRPGGSVAAAVADRSNDDSSGLIDDASDAIFRLLKRTANLGLPCPTFAEIADRFDLPNAEAARYRTNLLVQRGLVRFSDHGPRKRRVVTILASGRTSFVAADGTGGAL